jgi:NAD+ synthase (glutamine-hydrolysing)
MRITMGQLDPTVGDIEGNVDRILAECRRAHEAKARMAVVPELAVTGDPPRDLLNVPAFVRASDAGVARIVRDAPRGLCVVFGAPRRREGGGGRGLHNSVIAAEDGRLLLEVPKALLPTYDVFDEARYFEPAPLGARRTIVLDGQRIGLIVCEDMWNDRLLWGGARIYDRDPVAEAVEEGATTIVNVSASPFSKGKHLIRRKLATHAARRWGVSIVYVNAVGGNDGLLFDGGSHVVARDGTAVCELPWFEESVQVVDTDARAAFSEPEPLDLLQRALVTGVRDYARKTGMSKWVLGLSGGVDSALVAAIASLALGAGTGEALGMPSRYSSPGSVTDARALAEKLGLPFHVVPIEPAHAAYEAMLGPLLAPLGPAPSGDVTFENVQARIRGATLMAWANRTGGLLLTTGNKSECSVGYCTLYGDTCGGLAVIADLWKHEVYALARFLDERELGGAIPESTLTKPPSAELRPDQRDDQSLPPYDVLDPILEALVEQELGPEEAAESTGQPVEKVRAIARMLYRAEYKRRQFAPTLKVSARAWVGRDYPIAQRFSP